MKKLIVLAIVLMASTAFAWELRWDDPGDEDGIVLFYKHYPAGYSYPDNLAPAAEVKDTSNATRIMLPADTVSWEIPSGFVEGNRYVFTLQATKDGSVSGFSDFLCWTFPLPAMVIEQPVSSGSIQINIYQTQVPQ